MKKILVKILLFSFSLFGFGILIQKYIDNGIIKSGLFRFPEWNDIIESKINADLIIQGNSRAWMQISPYVIDSGLQLNSYNVGVNGYTFRMQYYRFLLYIKHNKKPKYLIQSVDCNTTLAVMDELFEFEQFLPFLNDSIIRLAVKEYNFFDKRDYLIPMYKYTHSFYSKDLILAGLKANLFGTIVNEHRYKGFKPVDLSWDESSFNNFRNSHIKGFRRSVDPLTNLYFDNFLGFCIRENIKVIFVFTPEYKEFQNYQLDRDSIKSILNNYSIKYRIPIFDYSDDSICNDKNNFWDSFHLNSRGVEKFNIKLLRDLKRVIE